MTQARTIIMIAVVPFAVNCMMDIEIPVEEEIGVTYQPVIYDNDTATNGRHANGRHANGERLNTARRGGQSISGVTFDKTQFDGVEDGSPSTPRGIGWLLGTRGT